MKKKLTLLVIFFVGIACFTSSANAQFIYKKPVVKTTTRQAIIKNKNKHRANRPFRYMYAYARNGRVIK